MFQNAFVGDPNVAMVLALAINTSRLEILSLNTNPGLTDTFAAHFFPLLDAPTFHEIHLSETGLTHQSALHIVEYITSPRCQLHILKANGNQLRIRAVRSIIRAARRANYSLLRLELLATGLNDPQDKSDISSSDDEGETKGSIWSWTDSEAELKRILTRNATLKHLVEKDALALLRYSRALLLRPKHREGDSSRPAFSPCSESCACATSVTSLISIGQPVALPLPSSTPYFPWAKLPMELQLHILSFLAPILSRAQRIRIFTYASTPSTLPTLLPCLSTGGGCIPDPASPQFGLGAPASGPFGMGFGGGVLVRKRNTGGSLMGRCANGKCMGAGNSVMCRREAERSQWLTSVRCSAFELEDDDDEEAQNDSD